MTTTTRQIRYAKILGNQIRALRKARGLTQAELAFRANMNVTYVGDVERANENISISKLILLADALEVPLSELLNSLDEQDISSKSSLVANIQIDLYKLDEKSLISLSEWIDYMLYKQRSR